MIAPLPLLKLLLRNARVGLGCMHILCSREYPDNLIEFDRNAFNWLMIVS